LRRPAVAARQLARVYAEQEREHDERDAAEPAADRQAAATDAAPVFYVSALTQAA
jgi:hypothetical protein